MPSPLRTAASFAVVVAALAGSARPAGAAVVERVVAVIGDRPILLSELRNRARPFLVEISKKLPSGPQQAAAESQVFKELLEKMIDEELEIQAADKAKVTVTADEIDNALKNIAGAQNLTLPELIRNAQRSGLTEMEYREELRRQLLEGKMLQLRVKGRVRITEEDVKAMFERTVREERKRREYEAAWVVIHIVPGSSPGAIAQREATARMVVSEARAGKDFGDLAKAYSDDAKTRDVGGDLGVRAPQGSPQVQQGKRPTLAPELDSAVQQLDPGQVTDPIKIAGDLVILKLVDRQASRYTTYEAAKQEMLARLQTEILEKAKRKWLDELKSHTHLDVRL
jgi:peptidyl-prolyl cis-trans isomerase SurA